MEIEQDGDDWVGVDEAAEIAGVSRWTIGRATELELPFDQQGEEGGPRRPDRRYRRRDVERYRDNRRAKVKAKDLLERRVNELSAEVAQLTERVDRLERRDPPPE